MRCNEYNILKNNEEITKLILHFAIRIWWYLFVFNIAIYHNILFVSFKNNKCSTFFTHMNDLNFNFGISASTGIIITIIISYLSLELQTVMQWSDVSSVLWKSKIFSKTHLLSRNGYVCFNEQSWVWAIKKRGVTLQKIPELLGTLPAKENCHRLHASI